VNITKPVRGFLLAGAATISAIAILPTSQRPASAASAITTPAFIADRAIVPPEGHGVTLAFGTGDNLYVLLSDGAQVQKFDATLTQLPYTGTGNGGGAGGAANQFGASTSGIAVHRGGAGNTNILNDRIIVADRVNNRIKVLDAFGNLVFQRRHQQGAIRRDHHGDRCRSGDRQDLRARWAGIRARAEIRHQWQLRKNVGLGRQDRCGAV